ncbi:unnamed protein product [Clavelina lepadiformis]|uniref:F-box protein n=1 Tax=Clavelina lepadiformis TaxID=159417 RepID=A0ABP0G5Q6_CLALP
MHKRATMPSSTYIGIYLQRHSFENKMETLPDLVLEKVFEYLDYKQLNKMRRVSWKMKMIADSEYLWKTQCVWCWVLDKKPIICTSWRESFTLYYDKYKKYIDCYRSVKSTWNKLEDWLKTNCQEIYENLNPGVAEEDIIAFEEQNNIILPNDFKLSYMLHNGQDIETENGLFGGFFTPSNGLVMISMLDFENSCLDYQEEFPRTLPFTSLISYQYTHGQVAQCLEPTHFFYSSKVVRGTWDNHAVVVSSSFSDWFSRYTDLLVNSNYLLHEGNILIYDKATEVSCTTGHITVKVRWMLLHCNNVCPEYILFHYGYYITMTMDPDAPSHESCQLESRHWDIVDADGNNHSVDGEGVVGEYPIMKPGATFSWNSFTQFVSASGSMRGYFVMRNLSDPGKRLRVLCPEFTMHPKVPATDVVE